MIIRFITLIILIFINGILSSSEIAYLSLDKYSLAYKRDKKSKKIYKMLENESKFLSTIQIGITISGFLASAFAAQTFTEIFLEKGFIIISYNFTKSFLTIIITLFLSYFTLVFGELVPKKIGRSNPLKVAKLTINLITIISNIFYPLIILLTASTNLICKILHIKDKSDSFTEQDIKKMIITGSREGIVEEKEKEYILNIFKFNDKNASTIMTPKDKVVALTIKDTKRDIIKKIKNTHFTRFPVLDETENNILGFINVKDFIYQYKEKKDYKIKDLLHPILSFNKNEKIDDIFRIMQEKHETMATITDKDQFIGILTMEDAIEEIVGNIEDEYN